LLVFQNCIESRQCPLQRLRLIGDLEFQERGFLDHILGTARVVDARKLDDDAVIARLLDQRLGNTELVDAGPDHLESAVDCLTLVGDHAFRFVDLQREVHAALEIEPHLERDALHGVVDELAVALHALDDSARKQRPKGRRDEAENDQ
jgi:hypothetical protein